MKLIVRKKKKKKKKRKKERKKEREEYWKRKLFGEFLCDIDLSTDAVCAHVRRVRRNDCPAEATHNSWSVVHCFEVYVFCANDEAMLVRVKQNFRSRKTNIFYLIFFLSFFCNLFACFLQE